MQILEGGLTSLEQRAMYDIGNRIGAKQVYIIEHTEALTTDEAIEYPNLQ